MSNNDKGQLDLSDLVAALCTAATALSAEDRAGLVNVLKNMLQNLAGQHSDVLETLLSKVWKRADVKFDDYPSEIGSMSSTTCHVVYAFLIPTLASLLQLKYQNKSVSPFETQPIEMGTFFTTFSLYCSTLVAENVAQTYHNKYSKILGFVSTVFGALSSLSLISLFLPKSIVVVILAICSVLSLMVAHHFLMSFCQWIYQKSVNAILQLINMFRTLMGRRLMEQNYLV